MDKFIINGKIPLHGDITPSGNKNAALPLLTACILTKEPVILHNIPFIKDVLSMRSLLEGMGANFTVVGDHSWMIQVPELRPINLDTGIFREIRASILLAGPTVARNSEFFLPPPGGDVIGRRRTDTHFLALNSLGVQTSYDREDKLYHLTTPGLRGANILLDEASVTATENAIMAAVTAKGDTTLRNAASEPHVQELCHFLNTLGAKIYNIGSNTLHIQGVQGLHGGEYTIGPDYLEVVSFIGATVVTGGSIRIHNAGVKNLDMIRLVLRKLGVVVDTDLDDVIVPGDQSLQIEPDLGELIPEISVMPWPAFPTDLVSIAIVIATQSTGSVLFHDWMYEGRMYFTDKLVRMGAKIVLCDPHRCIVQGPSILIGETLDSPDIRAGLALVLASLSAKGTSEIRNIAQIDRGYEGIEKKLQSLGADIYRTTD